MVIRRFSIQFGIALSIALCAHVDATSQPVLKKQLLDSDLSVRDLYYRSFTEINGYIIKILKENGKGDGNFAVIDYIDLGDKGFLRREKFHIQYYTNDLDMKWEVEIEPEKYLNVPKPFYQITANDHFIYFFESGTNPEFTYQSCKVTQINYAGAITGVSKGVDAESRVFSTFPSSSGLYYIGHRFLQGPEYFLGSFDEKTLKHKSKKIKLPHNQKEVENWVINKSEFEHVPAMGRNNYTWIKKGYIVQPMSDNQDIHSQYCKIDTAGKIVKNVEVPFDFTAYRNYLGIDTRFFEGHKLISTIVLKGAKTGPYFDIYLKSTENATKFRKELHFYDLRKNLREEYRYYDYHEINYNHYRNVDHFKAVIWDDFNKNYVLIDKVPDGTYFFHVNNEFELRRVDYAKEFGGVSRGSSQYNIGIVNGLATIYLKEGYVPKKTALDFIMTKSIENPRNYFYTVFNRGDYQLLIIDDAVAGNTVGYKLGK